MAPVAYEVGEAREDDEADGPDLHEDHPGHRALSRREQLAGQHVRRHHRPLGRGKGRVESMHASGFRPKLFYIIIILLLLLLLVIVLLLLFLLLPSLSLSLSL